MATLNKVMVIYSNGNKIQTEDTYNHNFDSDFDSIGATFNFATADISPFDTLKKYDKIEFYAVESKTKIADVATIIVPAYLRFTGYIAEMHPSSSKSDESIQFTCFSNFVLANEYPALIETAVGGNVFELLTSHMENAGLTSRANPTTGIVPYNNIVTEAGLLEQSIGVSSDGGKYVKEVVDDLKADYGYKIFQKGNGILLITSPFYLLQNVAEVEAWAFSKEDWMSIDYGDIAKNIEAIVVLGFWPSIGMAVDFAGMRNKGKTVPNYEIVVRRNLRGDQECDQVAKEELLDRLKDNVITITVPINFDIQIGQAATINDGKRFNGTELFIIQSHSWDFTKDSATSTLKMYAHTLTDVPQDLVLSSSGIADIDIINPAEKTRDENIWNNLGGL